MKVINLGARLSQNPETKVIKNEQGVNGMVNSTVNGKLFYLVDLLFFVGTTPVKKTRSVWGDDKGKFAISAEMYNKYMAETETEGEIVRVDDLPPYEVEGKVYTHANVPVLKGENSAQIIGSFVTNLARRNAPKGSEGTKATAEMDMIPAGSEGNDEENED